MFGYPGARPRRCERGGASLRRSESGSENEDARLTRVVLQVPLDRNARFHTDGLTQMVLGAPHWVCHQANRSTASDFRRLEDVLPEPHARDESEAFPGRAAHDVYPDITPAVVLDFDRRTGEAAFVGRHERGQVQPEQLLCRVEIGRDP